MREILYLSWRNLFRNPRRTLASLATVGFGAAALLIYQGFNTGIMNQYRENTIHGYYGYGQVFTKDYYGHVYEKPWEHWISDWTKIETDLKKNPDIKETFPRLSFFTFLVKKGVNLGGRAEGVLPERENQFFNQLNFISGKNIESDDEIILGKGLAESMEVKAGDTITLLTQTIHGQINGADLKVAGVFHMGIKAIDDQYCRIHLKQAQRLLDTDRIESFSLSTTGVSRWSSIESGVKDQTANLEAIPFETLDRVYYKNSVDFLAAQFSFIQTIILVIVILGIFNTISVGLLERGAEIGAFRANGESRWRVFQILILESGWVGLSGGIGGIICAFFVSLLLSKGIPMPPGPGITRQYLIFLEIQPEHYVASVVLPAIAAIVASLLPIYRLLNRSVTDLLRTT